MNVRVKRPWLLRIAARFHADWLMRWAMEVQW